MDWKKAKIPSGGRLFKVHNFTFMRKGVTYHLEVDEYNDGAFTGHGEHSTDKNLMIESVSATSVTECLEALMSKIDKRG